MSASAALPSPTRARPTKARSQAASVVGAVERWRLRLDRARTPGASPAPGAARSRSFAGGRRGSTTRVRGVPPGGVGHVAVTIDVASAGLAVAAARLRAPPGGITVTAFAAATLRAVAAACGVARWVRGGSGMVRVAPAAALAFAVRRGFTFRPRRQR